MVGEQTSKCWIQGEGSIVFGSNKTWTPFLGTFDTLKIIQNGLEMNKLRPPKLEGSRTQKSQTTKHYKASF
jgi:hypothetical protein